MKAGSRLSDIKYNFPLDFSRYSLTESMFDNILLELWGGGTPMYGSYFGPLANC